jgi:hypothetical protein
MFEVLVAKYHRGEGAGLAARADSKFPMGFEVTHRIIFPSSHIYNIRTNKMSTRIVARRLLGAARSSLPLLSQRRAAATAAQAQQSNLPEHIKNEIFVSSPDLFALPTQR